MRRLRWLGLLLLVLAAPVQAQTDLDPDMPVHGPWFLPREVFVGAFLGGATFTPLALLKWEIDLFHQRMDTLMFVAEGGGGYATSVPGAYDAQRNPPISYLYQFSAVAALGYRMDRPNGFTFFVEAGSGPLWYGARSPFYPKENRLVGTVVGRAGIGWRAGPVTTGVSLGVSSAYGQSVRSYSFAYLGGFLLGLYCNWR